VSNRVWLSPRRAGNRARSRPEAGLRRDLPQRRLEERPGSSASKSCLMLATRNGCWAECRTINREGAEISVSDSRRVARSERLERGDRVHPLRGARHQSGKRIGSDEPQQTAAPMSTAQPAERTERQAQQSTAALARALQARGRPFEPGTAHPQESASEADCAVGLAGGRVPNLHVEASWKRGRRRRPGGALSEQLRGNRLKRRGGVLLIAQSASLTRLKEHHAWMTWRAIPC
jgi:hypothetical protein